MDNRDLLLFSVFVPTAGAFLLPALGSISARLRNWAALLMVLVPLVASFLMLPQALSGSALVINKTLPLGFNFSFTGDALAVFMAMVSSFISAVIVLYSFSYISHYDDQNEYYMMVVLFIGSMMGLIYSSNLIFLYVFWEITGLTSWRLIGFFRGEKDVIRANKAFLVTVFGALAMLLGFLAIFQQTGSFDLSVIKSVVGIKGISNIAVILIMAGILSKSATLPFHTWLPDAGVAPSPVTALLHAAVLVKIGVYFYARIFIVNIPLDAFWHTAIPVIAGLSAIISAGAALVDTDIKRIIAYSTVSQIGFIFLGLAIGNEVAVAGALLYILMHGLAKAGLFLCAGIVEQNTHVKDITKLGGLIKTMPVTAIAFLFCALSVMGIPPFGGFFGKYMIFMGTLSAGKIWIALMFLVGAVMTILYLLRVFTAVFLGEAKMPDVREASPVMVGCVAALAILLIGGGIFIQYPSGIVASVVKQMPGIIR